MSRSAWLAPVLCCGCVLAWLTAPSEPFYRAPDANGGTEPYSAWYGDSDGRVLYFGTSPFWTLWWRTGGDPLSDLAEPGDHLVGRFDLEGRRFLPPFVVRRAHGGARSSVWDVLAHSNGRIYYTTFFEEMGSVRSDGTDVRHFRGLGVGLNEIFEGPAGNLYVTRYAQRPAEEGGPSSGGLLILTPDGDLVREIRFDPEGGVSTAPKSVAVDPLTGEIWLNADLFSEDGEGSYGVLRLAADGKILERWTSPPELQFVTFGPGGTGWLAEERRGELWLRAMRAGREIASASLGPRHPADFVQDIKPTGEAGAVLALWSARVFVASLHDDGLALAEVRFDRPSDCIPPAGRSVLYTAVLHGRDVFGTLYCGWTVLRAPVPQLVPVGEWAPG